ncbi:MAG: hypothetical protein WCP23_05890, partial [Planctomycetota bacterium]
MPNLPNTPSTSATPTDTRAPDVAAVPSGYDRDLLRAQIEILRREASLRSRLEKSIAAEHEAETAGALTAAKTLLAATRTRYDGEIESTKVEYAEILKRVASQAAADQKKLDDKRKTIVATITRTCEQQDRQLKEDDQFEEGSYREVFKDKRKDPVKLFKKAELDLAKAAAQLNDADAKSLHVLAGWAVSLPQATDAQSPLPESEAVPEALDEPLLQPTVDAEPLPSGTAVLTLMEQVRVGVIEQSKHLCTLKSGQFAFAPGTRGAAILVPILLGLAAAAGTFFIEPTGDALTNVIVAGVVGLAVIAIGIGLGLWWVARCRRTARQEASEVRARLANDLAHARRVLAASLAFIKTRRDDQLQKLDQRFAQQLEERQMLLQTRLADLQTKKNDQSNDLEAKYLAATQAIALKLSGGKEAAVRKYPPRLAALSASCHEDLETHQQSRDARLAAADKKRDDRTRTMTEQWRTIRHETSAVCDEANRIDAAAFAPWEHLTRSDQPLPAIAPSGLRFGTLALSLDKVPAGLSSTPTLNAFGPIAWSIPAIVPFPLQASLLIKTGADEKDIASEMMQAMTLRIASGVPAGQTRFTIIDPLGLGKHFAGFMHLADYDELLVTSRIWTEPAQIEQRLADITEQMELVIQKYLRNEYESIGAYNADAEVPEPYRFVVVANFPANFTETSARRLASIASSGARCGVYTIVSIDTNQAMPANFSIADIEKYATTLVLKDGIFTWTDPEFSKWPLTVEQAPSDEVFTTIIQRVGKAAKAAKRVEVPFDRVAPKEEAWWTGSTSSEINVPLG